MGAADVAEGVEGGDFSSCTILDRQTGRVAAVWHERLDATPWGEALAMLAIWYNAIIAPEINSAGIATLNRFMSLASRHVWRAEKLAAQNPYTKHDIGKWGWRTTAVNHEYMVQNLIDVISADFWDDPDEAYWDQALSVIRAPNGKALITGKDRVANRCILAVVVKLAPLPSAQEEEPPAKAQDYQRRDPYNKPPAEPPGARGNSIQQWARKNIGSKTIYDGLTRRREKQ